MYCWIVICCHNQVPRPSFKIYEYPDECMKYEIEEASTHKTALTHADIVFVPCNVDL